MRNDEILILEVPRVEGGMVSRPILPLNVTSHEGDVLVDAMYLGALVGEVPSVETQSQEVQGRHGHDLTGQLEGQASQRLLVEGDLEEGLGSQQSSVGLPVERRRRNVLLEGLLALLDIPLVPAVALRPTESHSRAPHATALVLGLGYRRL